MDPILNLERGGHRLILDRSSRNGTTGSSEWWRVIVNGVVKAQFAADTGDEGTTLGDALQFYRMMEVRCYKCPKPNS